MQRYLLKENNRYILMKIVREFHPDVPNSYTSPYSGKTVMAVDKIEAYAKYDWVCIRCRGASIAISFPVSFYGSGKKIQDFEKERRNNIFKSWRFVDDKKAKDPNDFSKIEGFQQKVHELLIESGVPIPTAQQMMEHYYSD